MYFVCSCVAVGTAARRFCLGFNTPVPAAITLLYTQPVMVTVEEEEDIAAFSVSLVYLLLLALMLLVAALS